MRTSATDARLCAEIEDGYLVATITRKRGSFSVTGEIHNSRRAYELGTGNPHSCGCIHEEILSAFPQLAPIVAMHMADVTTGEPMHGPANGWYWLSGADMMQALDALASPYKHRSYHKAPEPFGADGYGVLSPAFVQYFIDMAAHNLNCDADELSIWWDRADFDAFVEELRPRWQMMADEANRLIDAWSSESNYEDAADDDDCYEYAVELDAGLKLSAKLTDETGYRDGVGDFYQYAVKITAPGDGGSKRSYKTTFGGSVADYQEGRTNAREAAFSTVRELLTFEHETARGFIEESCGESWDDLPAEQRRALTRAERAFDCMSDALIANRETLGG